MSYKNNVTVIIGPAGSGKSTLVDLITTKLDFKSKYLFDYCSVDIEKSLEDITKNHNSDEILVTIDDVNHQIYRSEVMRNMIHTARHMNITLILTMHSCKYLTHELLNAKNIIFTSHDSLIEYVNCNKFDKSYKKNILLNAGKMKLPHTFCRITDNKSHSNLYDEDIPISVL